MRYIVSACLAGVSCRYDGSHNLDKDVLQLVQEGRALPACPDQLGGLPTPRPPAEFRGGDGRKVLAGEAAVADGAGRTVTAELLKGAVEFFRLTRAFGARSAVLRDRCSSCGTRKVTVDGRLCGGRGVAAALLEAEGLRLLIPSRLRRGAAAGVPGR